MFTAPSDPLRGAPAPEAQVAFKRGGKKNMEMVEVSGSVTNSPFASPLLQNKVLNIDAVKVKLQVRTGAANQRKWERDV